MPPRDVLSARTEFGDKVNPCRRVEGPAQIRLRDIIFRVSNVTGKIWHVTIALESPNSLHAYHVTDGNCGSIVMETYIPPCKV